MIRRVTTAYLGFALLTGCSFNPFTMQDHHLTGSPLATGIGAGIGAGSTALLRAPAPLVAAAGIGGGAIGYYATTVRFAAGNIIQAGGQVYTEGEYVGITIPSDQLFEPNTADFLPQAKPILESTVAVLEHYPDSGILVSGNTSGFASSKFELRLSEKRAKQVAGYLWANGINNFKKNSSNMRKLRYTGYGNYFPIATDQTLDGIRTNSRIQITAYPSSSELGLDKKGKAFDNIGSMD